MRKAFAIVAVCSAFLLSLISTVPGQAWLRDSVVVLLIGVGLSALLVPRFGSSGRDNIVDGHRRNSRLDANPYSPPGEENRKEAGEFPGEEKANG